MRTLHAYIARELIKTFLMTSVALTLLIVMGGGVANLFRGEGLGAEHMLTIFVLLTPVAVTLILPVAALFSATITYGRAAADNEVTACQAAGINVHRLLLSAVALGIITSALTYWSWNFLIPDLRGRIAEMSRRDLPKIVVGEFKKAKPLKFQDYRMTAEHCELLGPDDLPEGTPDNQTFISLLDVAFITIDDEEIARFGTADATVIEFDRSQAVTRVTVDLQNVRLFDAARKQFLELEHQPIGPREIPQPIRRRIKFENLPTLLEFRRNAALIPEVQARLHGLRHELKKLFVYDDIVAGLENGGRFTLASDNVDYTIAAEQFAVDPEDGRPAMRGIRVTEDRAGTRRELTADSADVEIRSGLTPDQPVIVVELRDNVQIRRLEEAEDDRIVRRQRESLDPIPFDAQPSLVERFRTITTEQLIDPIPRLRLPPRQAKQHGRVIEMLDLMMADVISEIHFRGSYALSAIAVILVGSILGIIVRGAQVLTAFGISCLPTLFVVLCSIIGRNLADQPQHLPWSIGVMWAGTAAVYLAAGILAFKVLRR